MMGPLSGRENPLVSIIIPVYNGSNYLAEAIDSALAQTYSNCEVIVVNDGSSDQGRSRRIAERYGGRIRYFEKENGGVASALNLGIREMRGEYFSWLSHDDLYRPEKIGAQVRAALASGDRTRLVQSEYEFYHMPTGTRTPTDLYRLYGGEQLCRSVFSVLWLQYHACGTLVHKSHFERAGLFDESIRTVQDIELWFRIFRGQQSLFVPQVLHSVREHPEAGSNTISCYREETGRLYRELASQMGFQEMAAVFGNAPGFLCRMAGFVKSYGCVKDTEHIKRLLEQAPGAGKEEEDASIQKFRRYMLESCGNRKKKIGIFGAGQYGLRIKAELESRLVRPDFFLDNDPQKWGKAIGGIPCISMEEAGGQKEELLVIIAQRTLAPALNQVKGQGFPYFTTKQRLDARLLHVLPAMSRRREWLEAL